MSLLLYADHNFHAAITAGVRRAGVNVLTSMEDGTTTLDDAAILDRAMALGRVVVTHDYDFIAEAAKRLLDRTPFAGVIHLDAMRTTIGHAIAELSLVAFIYNTPEFMSRLERLPL